MNERQTVRCQFPSQTPCRQGAVTIVEGTSLIVCGKHAGAVRELRGPTLAPAVQLAEDAAIEAAAEVVRTWLAALTRGDGRPVLIRREWPELARALDALSDEDPS